MTHVWSSMVAIGAALMVILAIPTSAVACPFCDGGATGRNEVKAAIFGEGFGLHLLTIALPFMVVVLLTGVMGFSGQVRRRTD